MIGSSVPWIFVILSLAGLKYQAQAAVPMVLPTLNERNVQCSPYPNFNISKAYILAAGITDVDKVELVTDINQDNVNDSCIAFDDGDSYEFVLGGSYAQCAASVTDLPGDIQQVTYFIRVTPLATSIISREPCLFIRVDCEYAVKLTGNLVPLIPKPKKHTNVVRPVKIDFKVDIGLFDFSYLNRVEVFPHPVLIHDKVYVGMWLEPNQPGIILQGRTCWATAEPDKYSLPAWFLIYDGCSSDDDTVVITTNFQGNHVRFNFGAFTWISVSDLSKQRIYIHCHLTVCDSIHEDDCFDYNCGNRKRREVPSVEGDLPNEEVVTIGPIVLDAGNSEQDRDVKAEKEKENPEDQDVQQDLEDQEVQEEVKEEEENAAYPEHVKFAPERVAATCDKNALGCSYDCGISGTSQPICVCPRRFVLASDEKTCNQAVQTISTRYETSTKMTSHLPAIALFACLIFCIVILLVKIQNYI